uniref:Uncharacterized protein n=1 Tax=Nicotiana tabacum TaxID=4097 RepID=A0A1S4BQW3_TOBAC|nr:PREDICTED: uncharacterized protein LOC107810874 [Nicotiana tabacum]
MHATTTKLTDISSVVVSQSSAPAAPLQPQVPPLVKEALKKILQNQKTITDTLVAHGKVIADLSKQVRKMKKSLASKRSMEKLTKEVEKIAFAGDLPLDLLMETAPSATQIAPRASAGQSEEPVSTSHTIEEIIWMFSNPINPQPSNDEI